MNHKVRHMKKKKAFLRRLGAEASGAVRKPVAVIVVGSRCGQLPRGCMPSAMVWKCHKKAVLPLLSAHCFHRKLFPRHAQSLMDLPPETPLIMWRKKGQDVTVFTGSHWSLMVVADGAECGILERDIHILTRKEYEMLPSTASLHWKWVKSDILSQGP